MKHIIVKPPRVAIILDGSYSTNSDLLDGILKFSQIRSPWVTDIRMGRKGEKMTIDFTKSPPDGIIVSFTLSPIIRKVCRKRIPVVLDSKPMKMRNLVAAIVCDNKSIAKEAALHLGNCGFSNFAFVSEPSGQWWANERLKFFREEIKSRPGATFNAYNTKLGSLEQWLTQLPKPVGVFAADDIRARQVSDAAHLIGVRIPDDISILGVDNDQILCETASPTLSSVKMQMQTAGFRAAEILHAAMVSARSVQAKPEIILYGGNVVARQSTHCLNTRDPLVARCRELLENNLRTQFSIDDLLPHLNVSRRTLETRFKAATGHTIHKDLLSIRINHAKILLRNSQLSQERIAESCGFHDASHLNIAFRRILGVKPSAFRTSNKASAE